MTAATVASARGEQRGAMINFRPSKTTPWRRDRRKDIDAPVGTGGPLSGEGVRPTLESEEEEGGDFVVIVLN